MEGKILAAKWCRLNQKPFLGICLGLQAAVIEYARNVLGLKNAHSTEMEPETGIPVVIEMPEHNTGQMGGTMRLGRRVTIFQDGKPSILRKRQKFNRFSSQLNCCNNVLGALYGGKLEVEERHRHRYEVNPHYMQEFEAAGLSFVGMS